MMLRKFRIPAILVALAAAGILIASANRQSSNNVQAAQQGGEQKKAATGANPAESTLRKASADYLAALGKGDLEGVKSFWATDADYISVDGDMTRGKDEIVALFKKSLPDLKGSKLSGKIHAMKFLRPEICLIDGSVEITTPTGTKESSRYAVVWTRTGEKWLISSVRDLPTEVTDLPSLASAQLKELEWLVGEWVDAESKEKVHVNCRWDTNKAFLLMDYTVNQPDSEPLNVTVRIGWDGANGRIRSWMFDTQGGFGEGYWQKDGNHWRVGVSGILPDGGTGGATNSYEFVDANTLLWKATDREIDGQPIADVEVKFVRKNATK